MFGLSLQSEPFKLTGKLRSSFPQSPAISDQNTARTGQTLLNVLTPETCQYILFSSIPPQVTPQGQMVRFLPFNQVAGYIDRTGFDRIAKIEKLTAQGQAVPIHFPQDFLTFAAQWEAQEEPYGLQVYLKSNQGPTTPDETLLFEGGLVKRMLHFGKSQPSTHLAVIQALLENKASSAFFQPFLKGVNTHLTQLQTFLFPQAQPAQRLDYSA